MAPSQSRIAELAAAIAQDTQRIDTYLTENNLPYPSFDEDAPVDLKLPPELEGARVGILQATQELNDLLQGPKDILLNQQHNQHLPLKLISHFSLAHAVPPHGSTTFAALAKTTGIDQTALTRILRFAIANRIFKEPSPGVIAHSATSLQIAQDPYFAAWIGAKVDEMWPTALRQVDALVKWPMIDEPHETAFALANNTTQPFYAVLAQDPKRASRFALAMRCMSQGPGYALSHLVDGYDWASIRGTVVDLGGSTGAAAFALARAYPHLHFIVQDLPSVIAAADPMEELDVEFVAQDFFAEQSASGCGKEVYLFRFVMHNWPDKYCVRMLRALVPALKKGARVVVNEAVVPGPGTLPNNLERKARAMDLTMMEIGNARERELEEWKALFAQADERFVFKGVAMPDGSRLSIIELEWDG